MPAKRYVVVTAAWNEEQYIGRLLASMVAQTVLPLRWVIVSDGSTDRTDEIIEGYSKQHSFVRLHRITEDHPRNWSAQVNAINTGFSQMNDVEYDFAGNLDADIAFDACYFEKLLEKFDQNANLGVGGGYVCEEQRGTFKPRRSNNLRSVPHAIQLFRAQCLGELGGYVALPYGGPDWHAEVRSRMNGWQVQSFADLPVRHYRPTGGAEGGLRSSYRMGLMDFALGSHPIFELAKLTRRLGSRPYFLGAFIRLCGYVGGFVRREKRPVSKEFVDYLRKEELRRLWPFGKNSHSSSASTKIPSNN
jgi:poly-beta-1,6-N-acetyl-D-glucosamine synthase